MHHPITVGALIVYAFGAILVFVYIGGITRPRRGLWLQTLVEAAFVIFWPLSMAFVLGMRLRNLAR